MNAKVSKNDSALVWQILDPKRTGYMELDEIHKILCTRYGKDKTSLKENTSIFNKAVNKIIERSGGGFKGLQRCLNIMDNNGDKRLSKEELQ